MNMTMSNMNNLASSLVTSFSLAELSRFCGAADLLYSAMISQNAEPLLHQVGKGDSTSGLQVTFKRWMKSFGSKILER